MPRDRVRLARQRREDRLHDGVCPVRIAADMSQRRRVDQVEVPPHQLRKRGLRFFFGVESEQLGVIGHASYRPQPRRFQTEQKKFQILPRRATNPQSGRARPCGRIPRVATGFPTRDPTTANLGWKAHAATEPCAISQPSSTRVHPPLDNSRFHVDRLPIHLAQIPQIQSGSAEQKLARIDELWASIPPAARPTSSADWTELDKRLADLRAHPAKARSPASAWARIRRLSGL